MVPSKTIYSYFSKAPASVPTKTIETIETNKRSRESSADHDDPAKIKKTKAPPKSKLKTSIKPAWAGPDLSMTVPIGTNAQKCIKKWNLIAPFATRVTEAQWAEYFEERSIFEKTNTHGTEEYKRVNSEELMQNTAVLGGCIESSERVKIAETLKGSLYYLDLWGDEDDGGGEDEDGGRKSFTPRTVTCSTRLYSPFGLGTSVDFKYYFHYHTFRANEKFAALVACRRDVSDCNKMKAFECAAGMGGRGPVGPPIDDSVRIFYWGGSKTTGTTAVNMSDLECTLFYSTGWFSPKLMYNLLCAGGTAGLYQKTISHSVTSAKSKVKLFEGEKEDALSEED